MRELLAAEINHLEPSLVEWRRDFHRHPELAFEEHRTSSVAHAFLESCGIDVRSCGKTGLRGVLRGGRPGRTVALRADMDALPVTELADHDYRSQTPGVMHACGHDGHMAILMGAARVLSAHREELPGNYVFLFQPSEERSPGGAPSMIADGALEGVDRIFGLHLWQPLPSGVVGCCAGPMMAQADEFRVTVAGRGGHASQPDATIDPILVASHLVVAAQAIVSRFADPLQPAVVSITTVHGGRINNVIPDTVELSGTVRTLDLATQRQVKRRLIELCGSICASFGATAEVAYDDGYPPLVNESASADLVLAVAASAFGADKARVIRPVMGGEDFAFYLERVPGAFAMLGIGDNRPHPHHNARFDIDESVLPAGVRLMTSVALAMAETGRA